MTIQHQCARNGCYKDKLPDWAILEGCFPRGIRPSDVDGIIEMSGHILMLEWKPANATLSTGQRLLFLNMTRSSPLTQAIVIYGDIGIPHEIELYQGGVRKFRQACDLEFLRWFCRQWGQFADVSKSRALPEPLSERRRGPRRSSERGFPVQYRLLNETRRDSDRRITSAILERCLSASA